MKYQEFSFVWMFLGSFLFLSTYFFSSASFFFSTMNNFCVVYDWIAPSTKYIILFRSPMASFDDLFTPYLNCLSTRKLHVRTLAFPFYPSSTKIASCSSLSHSSSLFYLSFLFSPSFLSVYYLTVFFFLIRIKFTNFYTRFFSYNVLSFPSFKNIS